MRNQDTDQDTAIIGAGVAGIACARALTAAGHPVRLLDKGRGPGGRTSTRRTDHGAFDHGAPFFAVSEPAFGKVTDEWAGHGFAARWRDRFIALDSAGGAEQPSLPEVMVGVPGMNGILKWMAADLDVTYGVRVEAARRGGERWHLTAEDGSDLGSASNIVVAVPSVQAKALLQEAGAQDFARVAEGVKVRPCWTVMAAFDSGLSPAFAAAEVVSGPLALAIHQDAKPGREADPALTRWVLHASQQWSEDNLEAEREDIARPILDAFMGIGGPVAAPVFAAAHRWRYAQVTKAAGISHLWKAEQGIGACGDWLPDHGPHHGIEAAWLSGTALAQAVLSR